MQLDAAVVRAGQAAAAQTAGLHAEVAAVFLHHDVAGDLGGAEEAVLALVDAQRLVDAVVVAPVGVVPARRQFVQWQFVGRVAIDLVGAHVDEHAPRGMRRVASSRFSVPTALTSKSSNGRLAARSWLGWAAAVDRSAVGASVRRQSKHRGPVADVELMVDEGRVHLAAAAVASSVCRPAGRRSLHACCCRRRARYDLAGEVLDRFRPMRPLEPVTRIFMVAAQPFGSRVSIACR